MSQAVNGYPTDRHQGTPKGALVTLIQSDNHIVFCVDLTTARKIGLQVSAKMRQLESKLY